MELSDFNKKLARTFVKDFNLPMSVISEAHFFYMLHCLRYENLWRFFVNTINSFPGIFESQVNQFFEERDRIHKEIINSIVSTPEYQEFNTCDMINYKIDHDIQVSKNKEYKYYVSIDLKNANIQALHYVNPKITFGKDTWENLVYKLNGFNTMSDYVIASKHFRQVLFGMLNPKRTITVEKHIMSQIYDVIQKHIESFNEQSVDDIVEMYTSEHTKSIDFDLVSFNNDEFVFGYNSPVYIDFNNILKETGFDVHIKTYSKKEIRLRNLSTYDLTQKFELVTYDDKTTKLKNVPGYLYAIVYQLTRGKQINNNHKHFMNDNMDCLIMDDFILCDKEGNEITETLIKDEI